MKKRQYNDLAREKEALSAQIAELVVSKQTVAEAHAQQVQAEIDKSHQLRVSQHSEIYHND